MPTHHMHAGSTALQAHARPLWGKVDLGEFFSAPADVHCLLAELVSVCKQGAPLQTHVPPIMQRCAVKVRALEMLCQDT